MKKYDELFIAAYRFPTVIDSEGYRPNVGIILCNEEGRLFWAKRIGQRSWQFPQGGIQRDESPEQAMFRELAEEVGLRPEHVQVIGCTKDWLRYRLPKRLIRRGGKSTCIGQKQIWFLLRMLGGEEAVRLGLATQVSETPLEDALAMARRIAGGNPDAIRAAKRLFNIARTADDDAILLLESLEQQKIISSPNQVEAVTANMQKRAPAFKDPAIAHGG